LSYLGATRVLVHTPEHCRNCHVWVLVVPEKPVRAAFGLSWQLIEDFAPCQNHHWTALVRLTKRVPADFSASHFTFSQPSASHPRCSSSEELPPEEAGRGETFREAAKRVADAQTAAGKKSWAAELARLEQHVLKLLGPMPVKDIRARHITEALENVTVKNRRTGRQIKPSRQTLKNILSAVSVVLDDLWRKEQLAENVARRVRLPKVDKQPKERAVLTDFELARYLAWKHPDANGKDGPGPNQIAVLERQTMNCIARLFGGVRTGDLHALRWQDLDAANGRFGWGYAPRKKTERPQRLTVDEMLRPILRRWWDAAGQPLEGLVFPVLRDGKHSKADKKDQKHQVSHAHALRQDLRRAFGLDEFKTEETQRKDGRKLMVHHWVPKRQPTPRETVLLEGDAHTLPLDFHSWRRAFCQSLADAGVNAQLAKTLAGHSTEAAHEKYLRSSEKARALPDAARPQIDLSKAQRHRGLVRRN